MMIRFRTGHGGTGARIFAEDLKHCCDELEEWRKVAHALAASEAACGLPAAGGGLIPSGERQWRTLRIEGWRKQRVMKDATLRVAVTPQGRAGQL